MNNRKMNMQESHVFVLDLCTSIGSFTPHTDRQNGGPGTFCPVETKTQAKPQDSGKENTDKLRTGEGNTRN